MKVLKNKKGTSVVELLILVAIIGILAITILSSISKEMTSKANDTTSTLLQSPKIDIDNLVQQKR